MTKRLSPLRAEHFRATVARVDLDRLGANFAALRRVADRRPVLAVVKADAYGHGAVVIARHLEARGAAAFGVALIEEGIELRRSGVRADVIALGGCPPAGADAALCHAIVPALFDVDAAKALENRARARGVRAPVHLKIDTGMSRLGLRLEALAGFLMAIRPLSRIDIRGIFTTLAAGDDPEHSAAQLRSLQDAAGMVALLRPGPVGTPLLHAANSSALGAGHQALLDLVRPGLALYGIGSGRLSRSVRPVLSLETGILQLKTIPKGTRVGYRGTFTCQNDTRIATLPIGYDDGLPRALSNRGSVLVRGRRAAISGLISMDLTTIDVSGMKGISVGDPVVVIGSMGRESLRAEELAEQSGTIPWEILCGIGARVPRVYLSNGREVAMRSRFA